MDALDHPIRYFEDMLALASAFKQLHAQIQEQSYHYEAFGSWFIVVRYKGIRFRVVFDGRDQEFLIERFTSKKSPDDRTEALWRKQSDPSGRVPFSEISDTLMKYALNG